MIRNAKKEDATQMAPLIMIIWEDMELEILEKYPHDLLETILIEAIQIEDYRFSYKNTIVYELDGKIVGLLCGYAGELEPIIDKPWTTIGKTYGLTAQDKVFVDKETFAGEWYVDSLVTHPNFRGRQIGTKLLEKSPEKAREVGEKIVGLNCDEGNPKAKKLYESLGFVPVKKMVLSGHTYDHMQRLATE